MFYRIFYINLLKTFSPIEFSFFVKYSFKILSDGFRPFYHFWFKLSVCFHLHGFLSKKNRVSNDRSFVPHSHTHNHTPTHLTHTRTHIRTCTHTCTHAQSTFYTKTTQTGKQINRDVTIQFVYLQLEINNRKK